MKSELTLGFKDSTTVLYYSFDYSDSIHIMLDDMYVTMSISTRLYPNLDLWTANKLQLQLQLQCTFWYKCDKPLTYTVFNTYLYNFVYINVFSDYFYIHVGYIM